MLGIVTTPSTLINKNNLSILLNSGYLAIALVIVLINLIYYLRLRDRLYLYFALYMSGRWLYLAAFGVSNFGYSMHFLRSLGVIPAYGWNMHAMPIATLCNMVLMTLALTERLHTAEEKVLAASRSSEQKAVKLATEMTVELREEREKLEMPLERQIRFVDMVSHEYRTPLAIITMKPQTSMLTAFK